MRAASLDKIQPPQRVGPLCEMRVTIPQAGDDPHPLGIERVEILIPTRRTRSDGGDAPIAYHHVNGLIEARCPYISDA